MVLKGQVIKVELLILNYLLLRNVLSFFLINVKLGRLS